MLLKNLSLFPDPFLFISVSVKNAAKKHHKTTKVFTITYHKTTYNFFKIFWKNYLIQDQIHSRLKFNLLKKLNFEKIPSNLINAIINGVSRKIP